MRISEEIQRITSNSKNSDSKLHRIRLRQEKPPKACGENSHFSDQLARSPDESPLCFAWKRATTKAFARMSPTTTQPNAAIKPQ